MNNHFRYDIEGLRALAVLLVVLFHLDVNFISGGFIGVDVFFVISGYLITSNIMREAEKGNFSFKLFYYKRARRLLPALYSVLFMVLIFGFLVLNPLELINLSKSAISSIFYVANIYFWQDSNYFDKVSTIKPLLNIWSLAIEEQFYFFWPIFLIFILKIKNMKTRFTVILFILISSIMITGLATKEYPSMVFYLMPFRISEFLFGVLVVMISKYYFSLSNKIYNIFSLRELLFLVGLMLILYSAVKFTKDISFPGYFVLIPTLGTILIILNGNNKYSNIILKNKIMVYIGARSYSIYLWHWPVIVYYKYIFVDELMILDKVLLFIISMVIGVLSYKYIETYFYKKNTIYIYIYMKI